MTVRDSLNDSPSNLVAMTRKQHALEHAEELQLARQAKLRRSA